MEHEGGREGFRNGDIYTGESALMGKELSCCIAPKVSQRAVDDCFVAMLKKKRHLRA